MNFNLRERTILLVVAGSRAYGIHLPTSDVDVKGVAIPTASYFHGYADRFEQADKPSHMATFLDCMNEEEKAAIAAEKLEGTIYDIRKFMALATDNNPNTLDVLFCRDEEVRHWTPLGRKLRENRNLFLSAKCKFTFSGYAAAQLKRIKGHRAWLLSPPTHQPTRAEFGLPEHTLIPADQLAAAQAAVRKQIDSWELDMSGAEPALIEHIEEQLVRALSEISTHLGMGIEDAKWLAATRVIGLSDNLVYVMQKEREYEAAHRHWTQYQKWKSERNADRAALEAQYGYDTKHAGHLVRLLRMGREILETGKVHVWRGSENGGPGDAEEIRGIRKGAWEYDRLIEWAEKEDEALNVLYKEKGYVVPKQPDREALDKLCCEMVEEALSPDWRKGFGGCDPKIGGRDPENSHGFVFGEGVHDFQQGRTLILLPTTPGWDGNVGDLITAVGHTNSHRGVPLIVTEVRVMPLREAVELDPKALGPKTAEEYLTRWDEVNPETPWMTNPTVYRVVVRIADWKDGVGWV